MQPAKNRSGILAKQDTGVVTTKAETVAHSDIHFAASSLIRGVIQITFRVWRGVIDRGRDQ